MIRVLVTGGNSQLAQCLSEITNDQTNNEIQFHFRSKDQLDITSDKELQVYFRSHEFDYCINCAAYTNVELAEDEPEKAMEVNAKATLSLAKLCKEYNRKLIHISTDYVFDGKADQPYKVTDTTRPISSYGQSKLQGELNIINTMETYFIIRASWLYSPYGKNFVKTMFNLIQKQQPLEIVNSQTGSPTSCYDLAAFLLFIIMNSELPFGIYHFASDNSATWYDIVQHMVNRSPDYPPTKLKAVSSFPSKASRPAYSVLDLSKTKKVYPEIRSWEEGVDEVMEKIAQRKV